MNAFEPKETGMSASRLVKPADVHYSCLSPIEVLPPLGIEFANHVTL